MSFVDQIEGFSISEFPPVSDVPLRFSEYTKTTNSHSYSAVRVLVDIMATSKAASLKGLSDELVCAYQIMRGMSHQSFSVQSSCEMCIRFICTSQSIHNPDYLRFRQALFLRSFNFLKMIGHSSHRSALTAVPYLNSSQSVFIFGNNEILLQTLMEVSSSYTTLTDIYFAHKELLVDAVDKLGEESFNYFLCDHDLFCKSAKKIDFVLLTANAIFSSGEFLADNGANGYLTAAKCNSIPVYVLSELHKFNPSVLVSDQSLLDLNVWEEVGSSDDIVGVEYVAKYLTNIGEVDPESVKYVVDNLFA